MGYYAKVCYGEYILLVDYGLVLMRTNGWIAVILKYVTRQKEGGGYGGIGKL